MVIQAWMAGCGTLDAFSTTMAIRIAVKPLEAGTLVKIDGELDAEGVSEVDAVCGSARPPIVLDLTELRMLDSAGEACLRRLIDGGATVDAAAPYLRMRLGLNKR